MAMKKSTFVILSILLISVWILVSAHQTAAETLNYRTYTHSTKHETILVGDVEEHNVIFDLRRGINVFENGEVATSYTIVQNDQVKGVASIMMYITLTFADGSTIILKSQGTVGGDATRVSAAGAFRSEIIKGTGRFEGIKGTHSLKTKFIPPEKGELGPKAYGEGTITYTLPSK
jgi:hypothetical protein